jgi:hypothetical protein
MKNLVGYVRPRTASGVKLSSAASTISTSRHKLQQAGLVGRRMLCQEQALTYPISIKVRDSERANYTFLLSQVLLRLCLSPPPPPPPPQCLGAT